MRIRRQRRTKDCEKTTNTFTKFVSVYVYSNYYNEEEGEDEGVTLDDEMLQTVLISLVAIWFVSAVTFASVIKREYLHTFYNMYTASTFNQKHFLNLTQVQDLEKHYVLTFHPDVYKK